MVIGQKASSRKGKMSSYLSEFVYLAMCPKLEVCNKMADVHTNRDRRETSKLSTKDPNSVKKLVTLAAEDLIKELNPTEEHPSAIRKKYWGKIYRYTRKKRNAFLSRVIASGKSHQEFSENGFSLFDVHERNFLNPKWSGKQLLFYLAATAIIAEIANILTTNKKINAPAT